MVFYDGDVGTVEPLQIAGMRSAIDGAGRDREAICCVAIDMGSTVRT